MPSTTLFRAVSRLPRGPHCGYKPHAAARTLGGRLEWALLRCSALLLLLVGPLGGQDFFPLEDVRAGLRATGRTVFSGTTVEEFGVEILGVLENYAGPKSSIIFGRLVGGPLEETGVLAGMSGSPVYIEGRLAGAVAFTYAFAKAPLAGIRPIGEMVTGLQEGGRTSSPVAVDTLDDWRLRAGLPRSGPESRWAISSNFRPIATPVSFSGFTERSLEVFGGQLERLGLRPLQGAGGGLPDDPGGRIEPGSMISVGLIRGDMSVNASGTVTHVDGNRILAFGHRLLSSGNTAMPLMRSSVMTLVPNLNASFKLSGVGALIGTISLDKQTGIAGELGGGPAMVPCTIRVRPGGGAAAEYSLEMVRDAQLAPWLLQMALYSAIDVNERATGPLTLRVRGGVSFKNGLPRLVLDDIYTGTGGVGQSAALSTAVPLAYLLQIGHPGIEVEAVDIEVDTVQADEYTDLVRAWLSKTQVRPGETVEIRFAAKDPDGQETVRTVPYEVPVSMPAGLVQVTVGDALSMNIMEWRGLLAGRKVRDAGATIRFLNSLRGSDQAYLRVWQRKQSLWLHADKLPGPPASVRAILATPAGRGAGAVVEPASTLADHRIGGFEGVVRGRLNLQFVVTGS